MEPKPDIDEQSAKPLEISSSDGETTLREYNLQDAEEIFSLIDRNRGHISFYGDATSRRHPTLQSVKEDILKPRVPQRKKFEIRNKNGTLVGCVSIASDGQGLRERTGEIAYYVGEEFKNKEYATNAVTLLTEYAFASLGYKTVYGTVAEDNVSSLRVLAKAGFKETDRFNKKVTLAKNRPQSLVQSSQKD